MLTDMPTTIKDKLPMDYHFRSQPLFYCDLDDTLHLSRSDASYHYHRCLINKAGRAIIDARSFVKEKFEQMRIMKRKTLPQYQKTVNDIKARLCQLLSSKDWKSTHATHAAKRREILELRYRLMFVVGEMKKEILKYDCVRKEYRDAKGNFETLQDRLAEAKKKAKEAEEYWKNHKDKDKA